MPAVLHHIALGARDVERVAAFYRDMFRLEEITRHVDERGGLRSVWLGLGGPILMVEQTLDELRVVDGVGAGPFLLTFSVTPARRAAFEREVLERGGTIESRTQFSSYARDPEGNRVAVSHYPK